MMQNLSLAAAMEAFVKRPELLDVDISAVKDIDGKTKGENSPLMIPSKLDRVSQEMELFMAVDPVLAGLHKEYLDACGILDNLAATNNSEYDAMAAVASDRVESAHSAFTTRLIELREDEKTKAMVEMKRHRIILEEMAEKREARRLREERAYLYRKDLTARKEQEAKSKREFSLDMFIGFMMMSWSMYSKNRQDLKLAFEDAFIGDMQRKRVGAA